MYWAIREIPVTEPRQAAENAARIMRQMRRFGDGRALVALC